MEVLIGFAVGYWVGTRQGRQGLERTMDSVREIVAHPETRHMLSEGLAAVTPLAGFLGKDSKNRGFAVIRGVLDEVIDRRTGPQAKAA